MSHSHSRPLACCPAPRSRPLRLASLYALLKSRRALAALDAKALDDVGLTAGQARDEAKKPIWDVPDSWRR